MDTSRNETGGTLAALSACAEACEHCAGGLLGESEGARNLRLVLLAVDTAACARLAAGLIGRGSELATPMVRTAEQAARLCAEVAATLDVDHARACARACGHAAARMRAWLAEAPESARERLP